MNHDPVSQHSLAEEIFLIGFECTRCGECCIEREKGSHIVMVSPDEIQAIMKITGMSWEEIAEPFPDSTEIDGKEVTFEWAIRRNNSECFFLKERQCMIYDARPWICRTYPFMAEDKKLVMPSVCKGIGMSISEKEAFFLAGVLLDRVEAEHLEEERITSHLHYLSSSIGKRILIDGEGIKNIHG